MYYVALYVVSELLFYYSAESVESGGAGVTGSRHKLVRNPKDSPFLKRELEHPTTWVYHHQTPTCRCWVYHNMHITIYHHHTSTCRCWVYHNMHAYITIIIIKEVFIDKRRSWQLSQSKLNVISKHNMYHKVYSIY
jgi:hypothetical protein